MAKLKAPLLSLGASGAIGKAIVFFPWKGLDCAREYVIPSNPKSTDQQTQRDYMKSAVVCIHAAQAWVVDPLIEIDQIAYALWASCFPTPRTWFNQAVKNYVDQKVAALAGNVFHGMTITEAADEVDLRLENWTSEITTGYFHYGTSKTNLSSSKVATVAGRLLSCDITGLVTGTKYYFQFRATGPASCVGQRSGIYVGTPL